MIIIVDNTDEETTYLQKLIAFMISIDKSFFVINDISDLKKVPAVRDIKCFIFSGSGLMVYENHKKARQKKDLQKYILHHYSKSVPIIGICFGAQFLNTYFEGTLQNFENALCRKKTIYDKNGSDSVYVKFCLHALPSRLGHALEPTYFVEHRKRKYVAAFRHKELPIYGYFFHPENDKEGYYAFLHKHV